MTTKADFDAVFKSIDTEATRIGLKFEELLAKLAAGGMSPTEEAATLAEGARLVDKLKTLGADPTNPVPVPEPSPGGEGEPGTGGGGEPSTAG